MGSDQLVIPETVYIHENEQNQFIYIQVPMELVVADCFAGLSGDAKILYGLLLNRTWLSIRKGWKDDKDRTFIYYTIEDVTKELHISHSKASRLFTELSNIKKVGETGDGKPVWLGLIEKVRVLNRPSRIYVHKVTEIKALLEQWEGGQKEEIPDPFAVENNGREEYRTGEAGDGCTSIDQTGNRHDFVSSGLMVPTLREAPTSQNCDDGRPKSETTGNGEDKWKESCKAPFYAGYCMEQEVSDITGARQWTSGNCDDGHHESETTVIPEIGRRSSQICDDGHHESETTVIPEMGRRSSQNCDDGHHEPETTVIPEMGRPSSQIWDENKNNIINNKNINHEERNHHPSYPFEDHGSMDDVPEEMRPPDVMGKMEEERALIRENIEYDAIVENQTLTERRELDQLIEIMAEACVLGGDEIIGGRRIPHQMIVSRFEKYDMFMMIYVMDVLGKCRTEVWNPKKFLFAVLYNAPLTVDNYYKLQVQHDLYGQDGMDTAG